MTYCVGIMLDSGLILASDSRTHAGVDNFAKFCKMNVFERAGDRVLVLLSSGNLAGTQAVIGILRQRADAGGDVPSLWTSRSMFDTAMLVAESASAETPVTFSRDVAPILFAKCSVCHHPGGSAPFSLLTNSSARAHATPIWHHNGNRQKKP